MEIIQFSARVFVCPTGSRNLGEMKTSTNDKKIVKMYNLTLLIFSPINNLYIAP